MLEINPKHSLQYVRKTSSYKHQADIDRLIESLRKAGLPETPPLPLPDKPSIAVLPFVNMSDDSEQEYFSDGISEEIITALSKIHRLFVIARTSSFRYKGKEMDIRKVGRELGVRYVLEGSVRKAGDKVRITAQLIDATTNNHLWAEKYDRELKDIFSLQDEITMKIITALQVKLTEGELARVYSKGTKNLDAYLKIMEANWLVLKGTKDGYLKARKLAEEAIALDASYPFAYRILGGTHAGGIWYGLSKNPTESLRHAVELMRKAVELDDSSAILHASLGYWLTFVGKYDEGIKEGEKALLIEPSSYDVLRVHATILTFAGRPEEAIPLFKEALRLNPRPSNALIRNFAIALRDSGNYEGAITEAKKATEQEPDDLAANVALTSSLSLAGREEEARAAARKVLRINPEFSVSRWEKLSPQKDRIAVKRYCNALRKVGLPD